MTVIMLLATLLVISQGEEMLNRMADRYSRAGGIQWNMQSEVHSQVFDETEKTPMHFLFNPPDTFYFKSEQEEIIGIADTLWVLSKRHQQIQKKTTSAYVMPSELITKWAERYELEEYSEKKGIIDFHLIGKEGTSPSRLKITADKEFRVKRIFYKDSSGDDVTLTVKKENLERTGDLNLFYVNIPKGYKLIDLTE